MKKIVFCIILIMSSFVLFSCKGEDMDNVKMIAIIQGIDDKIQIDVLESEYTFGVHLVITGEQTKYFDESGNQVTRNDLKIGDTIEIIYGGQVMMSYPPQIVALKISKYNS